MKIIQIFFIIFLFLSSNSSAFHDEKTKMDLQEQILSSFEPPTIKDLDGKYYCNQIYKKKL